MRVPLTARIGLVLIFAGAVTYAGIRHWMDTRIVYPIDMPISLASGHIRTQPFRLNLRADYEVIVAIPYSPEWDQSHPECNPYRHLQTRTVLYQDGKIVDQQDQPTTLPWGTFFKASPGTYELDIEVLNDFSCVDPIHPHLEIIALTEDYESGAFAIKVVAIVAVYLGLCSLLFVPAVRTAGQREERIKITETETVRQNFQWAQKLPLRPPISGLPGFGLVGGAMFAIFAMIMMMLTASPMTAKGLWVHLKKPKAGPTTNEAWTEPLVVRVEYGGPGQPGKVFVNSRPVAWDDLSRILKLELSLRQNWIVYVEGDDAVAWGDVANVVDIARGYHAEVFLTKPQPGQAATH